MTEEKEAPETFPSIRKTFVRISKKSLFQRANKYEIISPIGEGTYGQVYKARTMNKEIVAMKRIVIDKTENGFPLNVIREIKILKTVQHKNIIPLLDVHVASKYDCIDPGIYLVFPYMAHDLSGINHNPAISLSGSIKKYYIQSIVSALACAHRYGVIHRDIKAANILVSGKGQVQLADFGLSRTLHPFCERYSNRMVTLWYRPLELLYGQEMYGPEIDVWGVGCVMVEILTGQPIFPGGHEIIVIDQIFRVLGTPTDVTYPGFKNLPLFGDLKPKKVYHEDWGKYADMDPLALDLLKKLLVLDPKKRISMEDALDHPYFTSAPLPWHPHCGEKMPEFPDSHDADFREERAKKRQSQRSSRAPTEIKRAKQAHPVVKEKVEVEPGEIVDKYAGYSPRLVPREQHARRQHRDGWHSDRRRRDDAHRSDRRRREESPEDFAVHPERRRRDHTRDDAAVHSERRYREVSREVGVHPERRHREKSPEDVGIHPERRHREKSPEDVGIHPERRHREKSREVGVHPERRHREDSPEEFLEKRRDHGRSRRRKDRYERVSDRRHERGHERGLYREPYGYERRHDSGHDRGYDRVDEHSRDRRRSGEKGRSRYSGSSRYAEKRDRDRRDY